MPPPLKVYIAGPYTKPDPCVNTRQAILVADELLSKGLIPFVPHLSHFWHTLSPKSHREWLRYDLHWVRVCDCLLRLPGESTGADMEVEEANRQGIMVFDSVELLIAYAEGATVGYKI